MNTNKKNGAFYVRYLEEDPEIYGIKQQNPAKETEGVEKDYFRTKKKSDDKFKSVNTTIKWQEALKMRQANAARIKIMDA